MHTLVSNLTQHGYTKLLKPYFFRQSADVVHTKITRLGKEIGQAPALAKVVQWAWSYQNTMLERTFDGIHFPNPVGLAAGFDYDADLITTLPKIGFGFHTLGTVTLEPYEGNPPPMLARYPRSQSLLVNKGLKNIGAKAIIAKLKKQKMTIPTGISIASTNREFGSEVEQIANITDCFRLFEKSPLKHSYYELNISCPNTFGGHPFTTPEKLERLMVQMDVLQLTRPLYVKMPIDQDNDATLELLKILDRHETQGVVLGNLTKDKSNPDVDPQDREQWQNAKGNLSGKPTWHRSNEKIKLCRETFDNRFTIIGTGGIFSGEDAAYKLELGADLVQLITGMIYQGPQLIGQINKYLADDH